MFDSLTILYGSETGNCQDLAKIISWKISQRYKNASISKFTVKLSSCDDYEIQELPNETLILFVCSTTGIGEEPHNMKKFWRFMLRRDLNENSLVTLNFAVIGLGDSSYLKYNFVAKKLFKRLTNIGAKPILELVLGDDQHELGPYVKIDPWLKQFYNLIIPDEFVKENIHNFFIQNSIQIENVLEQEVDEIELKNVDSDSYDSLHPYLGTISNNERMTSEDHFQDTRLISIHIQNDYHYNLGDVCVIYPENDDCDVEKFLSLFPQSNPDYMPDRLIKLTENLSCSLPKRCYYRHAIKYPAITVWKFIKCYMELTSVPKRSFFELLYQFSEDELERMKLKQFADGTDLDELYDYVNRPKRTILEVLCDFPHTTPHIPFRYLFDLIPSISPRPYSVASTPTIEPNTIKILVAVVEYQTRIRKPRRGLCSTWLSSLVSGQSVRIFLRKSNFSTPNIDRPLVMISAGTGVAPFIAFILDRTFQKKNSETILFFGCRYRDKDFYFDKELQLLSNRLQLFTAFSREHPNESKVYVQNRILEQSKLIERILLKDNGLIWIAGRSQQYPTLVRDAIRDSLKGSQISNVDSFISSLETKKRIVFECW